MSILAAAGIAGGATLLGGVIGNMIGANSQRDTNRSNEALTREGWAREDTSIQRRVADLKAAGLSPVLAAGQGASTMAPARMEAPKYQDVVSPAVQASLAAMTAKSNIGRTQAETDLLNVNKDVTIDSNNRANEEHNWSRELHPVRLANYQATVDNLYRTGRIQELDAKVREYGITQAEIDIANSRLQGHIIQGQISAQEQEAVAKSIAIDMARERLITESYNRQIGERFGIPSGASPTLQSAVMGTMGEIRELLKASTSPQADHERLERNYERIKRGER